MLEEDLSLKAVSPIDGRYYLVTSPLSQYFSEYALYRYRIYAELEYLLFFLKTVLKRKVSKQAETEALKFVSNFDLSEAKKIKAIEKETRHDVKAVEYYLRPIVNKLGLDAVEYLHFGLTSEDVNSIAYGLILKNALKEIIVPEIEKLINQIEKLANRYQKLPMLARTHGQVAVPTTLGKELIVFAVRVTNELQNLKLVQIEAKLTGAVGNYNALYATFPKINWVAAGDRFIKSLGLAANHFTTQILPADRYVKVFQSLDLINSIIIGFDQDMWRYISDDYFKQRLDENQVGSSTMPHKINPIDFENSEGNLGIANALLRHLSSKLPISRLQRDLSDSTVKRNIGSALTYSLLGYRSSSSGLGKVTANESLLKGELSNHWEVISEGIQTILRADGNYHAYEDIKEIFQGKQLNQQKIDKLFQSLSVSSEVKKRLNKLTPYSYTGLAQQLVRMALKRKSEKK